MIAENETFTEKKIQLDGSNFSRCTFNRCTLVFSGLMPANLDDCKFFDCTWAMAGSALSALQFLQGLYTIDGGAEVVEKTFDNIRGGAPVGTKLN